MTVKKIILFILAGVLTATLSACGSTSSQADYDKGYEAGYADGVKAAQDTTRTSSEAVISEQEDKKAENGPGQVGTRKNPAKTGDTVSVEVDSAIYGNGILEITLTEITRGDAGAKTIAEANIINKAAPEGKEYVLATFLIKNIKDKSSDDTPIEVNGAQFSFANSKFAKEDQMNMVVVKDSLSAELYEGAETAGTVVFLADSGDSCFAIYGDEIWFALS